MYTRTYVAFYYLGCRRCFEKDLSKLSRSCNNTLCLRHVFTFLLDGNDITYNILKCIISADFPCKLAGTRNYISRFKVV